MRRMRMPLEGLSRPTFEFSDLMRDAKRTVPRIKSPAEDGPVRVLNGRCSGRDCLEVLASLGSLSRRISADGSGQVAGRHYWGAARIIETPG